MNIVDPTTGKVLTLEDNGDSICMPVCVQDQHTRPIDSLFAQQISAFTIAADTGESGLTQPTLIYSFTATAGHGISPLDPILLLDVAADRSLQCVALNVVGNAITIDRPIDHDFKAATTLGRITAVNMAVNGSVTEQIFTFRAGSVPTDCTRFILTMRDNSSMDDNTFGGLPALTRGVVLRTFNGSHETLQNWKTNGDITQFCYDTRYNDKAPAGQFGLTSRITYGGQDKHGVVIRISGTDAIQIIVQDDLTGLISFQMAVQGHLTQGET
jgi:hypothetical protein